MSMTRMILSFGALAGLIVGLPLFAITVAMQGHPPPSWGVALGYATMLVALSLVFVAVKRHRDQVRGGVIGFWPAFGVGLAISGVASLGYVLAWELALAVTGIDFGADYARAVIDSKQAAGLDGAALEQLRAEMAEFARRYRNPLFRVPMTLMEILPVGVLVSAVTAGLLRNSRFMPARRG
jgi:hypothetical protein